MKKIVFLGGGSTGDVLNGVARMLKKAYVPFGYELDILQLHIPDQLQTLVSMLRAGKVAWATSIAGVYADITLTENGKPVNLWRRLNVPYIGLYGDSPAYFFDRHVNESDVFASVYGFPDHLTLRKRLPHVRGPLGVLPPICHDDTPIEALDFKRKRDGKIYFFKNGNDPAAMMKVWRETLPRPVGMAMLEIAEQLTSNLDAVTGTVIDDTVRQYFADRWIDIDSMIRLRLYCVAQLDDFLRRVKSAMIASVLSDFPVVIQGHNWEHMDFSNKPCTFVSGGDFDATRSLIEDSLATIDMSPNTTLAPHERPLRAFGLHTLCLTNEQQFFKNLFPELHRDFSFSFNRESIGEKVADVLANRDRYIEVGIEAARGFRQKFDFANYVNYMELLADTLRIGSGNAPLQVPEYQIWPPKSV